MTVFFFFERTSQIVTTLLMKVSSPTISLPSLSLSSVFLIFYYFYWKTLPFHVFLLYAPLFLQIC